VVESTERKCIDSGGKRCQLVSVGCVRGVDGVSGVGGVSGVVVIMS
jgi:hypothetical protein